ncbi:hypothetical protein [Hafnia paralvei]|jgi:hypothetical protein|uniref:hypothetical protein n=1 Tax=Hafnia paralvei TaxID=546367 RepID=UPI003A0FE74A
MAAKVVACFRQHDWRRNADLIALRRTGYTPYSRASDPSFTPKPMRITPRSESREALTSLSLVLAANWALLQIVGGDKLIIPFC